MKNQNYFLLITTMVLVILSVCNKLSAESKLNQVLTDSISKQLKYKQIDSIFITGVSLKTGKILISVKAEKTINEPNIQNTPEIIKRRIEPKELFIPFSILNILGTGNVKEDDLKDTYNGIRRFGKVVIKDNSYIRGGYGVISLKMCIPLSSNIGTVAFCKDAFKKRNSFYSGISDMNLSTISELNHYQSTNIKTAIGCGFKTSVESLIKDFSAIAYNENITDTKVIQENSIELRKINCSPETLLQVREMLVEKGNQFKMQFNIPITKSIGGMSCTDFSFTQNVAPIKYICYFYPAEKPEYIYFINCYGKQDDTLQLVGDIINITLVNNE